MNSTPFIRPFITLSNKWSAVHFRGTGFNILYGIFASHKILLFTHKPLDTHDKVYRAESYQNLINGLFENLEILVIAGVSDFFNLFPLDKA